MAEVGSQVRSTLYRDRGVGTVVRTSTLFDTEYLEILFSDGSRVTTSAGDVVLETDPLALLQSGQTDSAALFLCRNLNLRLQANLSENRIVTSTNYKIKPLPHQLLTVDFVMNRFQPRSLIADEVGLGKTIEAILIYEEFKLRGIASRVLIVVPSGLVLQWHEELLSRFGEQFVIYTTEYIHTLKQSYGKETNVWMVHDKIIASIDSIKPLKIDDELSPRERQRREWHNTHVYDDLAQAGFDLVIIDEAHKLSKHGDGSESARYKLGETLSEAVPILLLLTATPHQGDEYLFLHLLRLIDPVLFTSTQSLTPALVQEVAVRNKKRAAVDFDGKRLFKHRITSMIEISRNLPENEQELRLYELVTEYTSEYYNKAQQQNNQILKLLVILYQRIVSSSSFALLQAMRRRQAFLENQLHDAEQPEERDWDEEEIDQESLLIQRVFTDAKEIEIEKQFVVRCIEQAEKCTAGFQDAKFRKLIEVIDEIKEREDNLALKFLIFTEFRATQDAIIAYLEKFGISCAYINGSLSREQKVEQVEAFRESRCQVMVSTDAGGEGINLQFCYCVINFDLPWNPSRLEQRIGRVDRIGQTHNALIFNFHLIDTVEDRVRQILEKKLKKIKEQFGEDKYADVLNLLQEEFSFDQIYIDAIRLKTIEDAGLDKLGEEIVSRARTILSKDELLLPFTEFSTDAKNLINTQLNPTIKHLVLNYLEYKGVEVTPYKEDPDYYYFANPFHGQPGQIPTYRQVTFENSASIKKERIEFINIDHPLLVAIQRELEQHSQQGRVAAIRAAINKFQTIRGYWFVYRLTITNNDDKHKTALVSVFMEDADYANHRISQYLMDRPLVNADMVQNYTCQADIQGIADAALKEAEQIARDRFFATRVLWMQELDRYERKFGDYYRFKENAIRKIRIDNIRSSQLQALNREKQEKHQKIRIQRNVIPRLELYQVAFVEFV